ncbi:MULTISPECIES: universal stress protein [Niastella]|uniref:Universal stress protein n=1 Tax=Niastella soli TaxID=2821487 RepID=A0ABS3YWF8_9BACT|nr:universal stress protein [Niastella soli]MBO9202245.1 universal stress protein [Niastella soli]
MSTVLVVTNFSDASRNALEYTCSLLQNTQAHLILMNIYNFPGNMTGDAIAIAAMGEIIEHDAALLEQEYQWVQDHYPSIIIDTEMVTGSFQEELLRKVIETNAVLVVMGTDGNYTNLLSWDTNIVDSFIDLPVPMLVIPSQVRFRPVNKIAFACNYYRKNLQVPVSVIRRLVRFTSASLYVINVVAPHEMISEEALHNKQVLQESLADLNPVYFEPEYNNVISAIDNFTADENIDMLLVIPTRHGIWYNIFQKSHTKGLVYLNHIPLLSVRQQEEFI